MGFVISHAEDIEEVGWKGIVKRIRDTVGNNAVYSKLPIPSMYREVLSERKLPWILMSSILGSLQRKHSVISYFRAKLTPHRVELGRKLTF